MTTVSPRAQKGKATFIYVHIDPVTCLVRYVGKSDNPQERLSQHLLCTKQNEHTEWIEGLKLQGLLPIQKVIEEVPYEDWQEREKYWIAFFRELGMPLTNVTSGGNGVSGYVRPSEVQSKIAGAIRRGKARNPKPYIQVDQPTKQKSRRTSTRKKGATFTNGRRRMMQNAFLKSFALTNNITASCASVGIDRQAFYYWLRNDEQFCARYQQIEGNYEPVLNSFTDQKKAQGAAYE